MPSSIERKIASKYTRSPICHWYERAIRVIHPPDVDRAWPRTVPDSTCEQTCGRFPVERHLGRLREVIAGTAWNHAEWHIAACRHDAVDGFVNAAVPACDDEVAGLASCQLACLQLEIANAPALTHFDPDPVCLEQAPYSIQAASGPAAAGDRID
jgi:hypothetical protein